MVLAGLARLGSVLRGRSRRGEELFLPLSTQELVGYCQCPSPVFPATEAGRVQRVVAGCAAEEIDVESVPYYLPGAPTAPYGVHFPKTEPKRLHMSSLTLKGVPDEVMIRLRERAESERRSLNQQAIRLLEAALARPRPGFAETYDAFLRMHGPSPIDDETYDEVFRGLRDRHTGRASPFEGEEGR